jgi:non-specific serine/threonine protein kinase
MSAFWSLRGHHTEGRQRLGEVLGLVAGGGVARVGALTGAAWLALDQGDYAEAAGLLGESIQLSQALGDTVGEAIATACLGRCKLSGHRIAEATPDVERAAALAAEAGDRPAIAFTMFYSAVVALVTGRLEAAAELWARCVATAVGLGLEPLAARASVTGSYPLLDLGDLPAAKAVLAEGLSIGMSVGDRWFVQIGLGACIGLAAKTGRPRLALRLAGAAEAYRGANEFSMPGPMAEIVERWLVPVRASADQAAAAHLLAEGRRLSPEDAVRLALANEPDDAPLPGPRRTLTRRETEVAVLAARGMTNRDVAAELYLSVRTVEVHIDHILTKLGFRTRTQLAAWAYAEGLLPSG